MFRTSTGFNRKNKVKLNLRPKTAVTNNKKYIRI